MNNSSATETRAPKTTISLRVDIEMKSEFDKMAQQKRRTPSDLFRLVLEDYLKKEKQGGDIQAA